MKQINITIHDSVWSEATTGKELLKPCLSFPAEYWQKKQFGKQMKSYRKSLFEGRSKLFLTGFINKIQQYCLNQKIELSITNNNLIKPIKTKKEPYIEGLNIKDGKYSFQYELIIKAIESQRGVIKAATASGKTIIMLGLISCFPKKKILFLSDTYVPITQFKKELEDRNFPTNNITATTIQSQYRKPLDEHDKYDIILIDECHGVSNLSGMYAKVLKNSLAPIRLGFTATLPRTLEGKLALEGLLGPVIGELTIQEGTERGVLAVPKIIIREVPENSSLKQLRGYQNVYKKAVVENKIFNRLICKDTKAEIDKGKTVLILVIEIQHGKNLVKMAKELFDFNLIFVRGSTEAEAREKIRLQMNDKKVKAVVATAVFRKALNIRSLDTVINACGGKSEVVTLQSIGRGLRKTKDKEFVKIIDYFNPNHYYLVDHFGRRLSLYFRESWL